MKKVLLISMLGVVVLGLVTLFYSISVNNTEKGLRNRAEAQRGKIENVHDKMWKVLQQKAQVSDQYKEAFMEIYPELISGRYSQGDGSLMKWVQEANPDFNVSLYQDLMRSIEVERNYFATEQNDMLDIKREHTNLLQYEPSSWFIKNKKEIEYTVISSTRSKEVMGSGVDNDINLF